MDGATSPVTTPAAGETLTFGQTIEPKSFIGLSLKNGLLNIVTLTLYRFWGKTEVRRRVWSHVTLNGEPFEYTGRGKELFMGFLLATLFVGVPYLALILAIQFVSPLFTLLLIPVYIVMIMLIGMAIFMTYRYQASRTIWRGVRFHLSGKATNYGLVYLGYGLVNAVSLGWFSPAMTMRLSERIWSQMAYGDQPLSWKRAEQNNLYGPFAIAWVVGFAGYIALLALMIPMAVKAGRTGVEPGAAFVLKIYGYALVYTLMVVLASVPYHAAVLREIGASIRIGEARLRLDVKGGELLGLTISNILIVLLSLGFLQPVAMARTVKFLISRLSAEGTVALAEAHQAPRGPKTGEGLADAFDVSPF
ncbi:YjgN family protein [Caulobacter sp. RL271]|uniref:YjgN family protein n=1 Tax=Caulobacter segnis TaxID=88688 RepID=A0ABY4ZY03_9CAUL|nr:YjgN family protein [Caulobacter segnis]USQ97620.1 YjgN family protein [Caulobacter segnis]